MGFKTDKMINTLGGKRLLDVHMGDAGSRTTVQDYEIWREKIISLLLSKYPLTEVDSISE